MILSPELPLMHLLKCVCVNVRQSSQKQRLKVEPKCACEWMNVAGSRKCLECSARVL